MRRLEAYARVDRLIDEAVVRFALDLRGIDVLTETASGPFVVTPLIAARAGASVIAVTRDSRFGTAEEVKQYTAEWARRLGVAAGVEVHVGVGVDRAADADLVTNLGFVRPIGGEFVARMRPRAVVSLMCEPWEARREDTDIGACRAAGVPVLGTNERDPRVNTFRFVGILALRLLFDLEIEVLFSQVVVISSEPFVSPIVAALSDAGAEVIPIDVTTGGNLQDADTLAACARADAVVVAEHRDRRAIVGGETGVPVDILEAAGAAIVHIAGAVVDPERRLQKHPEGDVAPGVMTVTTDLVGPRPVIDLHAAGLRVGQALVEAARRDANVGAVEAAAIAASPALATGVAVG